MKGKEIRRRIRERRKSKRRRWLMIAGGVAGLALVAAFLLWPNPTAPKVPQSRIAEDPSIGPTDAPVTMVEYGDFGCPSCRAWHNAGVLDRTLEHYGESLRFVWRDFPIITAQSPKAAEAAQCAYDQGKFWEYHDLLYARAPALAVSNLKSYAAELGLDGEAFNRCLDSGQHEETVRVDFEAARKLGLRGTPSFVVNGQVLVGPISYEYLTQVIDPVLTNSD